jgi:hypothetical protein
VELVTLLSHPSTRVLTPSPEPQAAVATVLGGLDDIEDDELKRSARHGMRHGQPRGGPEGILHGGSWPPQRSTLL